MVRGIERFRESFREHADQYVFIGGTACDIILGREEIPFRQTKDLDMVLIVEVLNQEFIEQFIDFVSKGRYQHINKGTGKNQFYRFEKPGDETFPYMIELFSRKPSYLSAVDTRLAPIYIRDDILSLSAILLDDEYYYLLKEGAVEVDGISVLSLEYIILFKMKAWLDLSERKRNGEQIDSKNIKKHKNDVIRLAINLHPEMKVHAIGRIGADVKDFLESVQDEKSDLKALGIRNASYESIIEKLRSCFILKEDKAHTSAGGE